VIVVIGVLAAISLVSYSGINSRAIVASLKSDLSNGSKQLKIFQVTGSGYPGSVVDCPTPSVANVCLKLSGGNEVESYTYNNSANPQTFELILRNGSVKYVITQDSEPMKQPIFASGGVITSVGETRTHTFGVSCTSGVPCTITALIGGTFNVSILGAGGGGGVGSACCGGTNTDGTSGGNSSVLHITNNATYVSNGGGGGTMGIDPGDSCTGGSDGLPGGYQGLGTANLTSWGKTIGGGSPGGAGGGGCAPGGTGGSGGLLTGVLTVTAGQQIRVIVGAGGIGGYEGGPPGSPGSPGSVIISY